MTITLIHTMIPYQYLLYQSHWPPLMTPLLPGYEAMRPVLHLSASLAVVREAPLSTPMR